MVCKRAEHLHICGYMLHSNNWSMQHGYFQKRKQINLLTPLPGVKGKCKSQIFAYLFIVSLGGAILAPWA